MDHILKMKGSAVRMILLKANSELKAVFIKLINTMGRDIKWTEVFIINNNNLILAGKDSVLVFDFGNKKIGINPLELQLKEDTIEQIIKYELLENVLNMVLYVFGKWGKIKGLVVEKDYPQLNKLFGNSLKEIRVEPALTEDNLRFYKEGRQITYEDVIQDILDQKKEKELEENGEANSAALNDNPEDKEKYNIGLWHKMVWTSNHFTFKKVELSLREKAKPHIAKNFNLVSYVCPVCNEKLSMVVYPEGKELLIETDEKGVYLSRAYACSTCHQLFTPKPQMLLMEGNVFTLAFEDDGKAYDDYLDLIGEKGERTSNCNFNEYEADYNNINRKTPETLDEVCDDLNSMSDTEVDELKDKMDSGYYPQYSIEKYRKTVDNELQRRAKKRNEAEKNKSQRENEKTEEASSDLEGKLPRSIDNSRSTSYSGGGKNLRSNEQFTATRENSSLSSENSYSKLPQKESETRLDINREIRNDTDIEIKKEIPAKNNTETNAEIKKEKNTASNTKIPSGFTTEPGFTVDKREGTRTSSHDMESGLQQKVDDCKDKSYAHILRTMEEIKKAEYPDHIKQQGLNSFSALLEKRGKKELDSIIGQLPENINKKQYLAYVETIEQYKEIDTAVHRKTLDYKRDEAEKQEITAYLKRANAKDRHSHMELYHKLKNEDFEVRNVTPFLESIHDKIYHMDERTIKKICPDPLELTFEDGLQAYEKITAEDLLPELKTDVLRTIDQRLTKIKMNECEQLVNKLSKDMRKVLTEGSRIHFYDIRKAMRNDLEDREAQIINKALTTYAAGRSKYEFPIMICDSSPRENGGRGFVLTPDHIYYNTLFNSGEVAVAKVESIASLKRLSGQGIYAESDRAGKIKLSNSLKLSNLKQFAEGLNDFISYLKEKPESRKISYLAKEKHNVICCYRCGYVYKGSSNCPKCGARFNE